MELTTIKVMREKRGLSIWQEERSILSREDREDEMGGTRASRGEAWYTPAGPGHDGEMKKGWDEGTHGTARRVKVCDGVWQHLNFLDLVQGGDSSLHLLDLFGQTSAADTAR